MTVLFWLFAGLLILTALVLIIPPLWRQQPAGTADVDRRNVEIAKARLAELKEQLRSGVLSLVQYDEQRIELELALSDDLAIAQATPTAASQGRWLVYVIAGILPLMALGLYAGLGTYQAIEPTPAMLSHTQPTLPNAQEMATMVNKLAERMQANPNDAKGWEMLGKSYKYLEQYSKSAEAFGKAYALLGEQSEIMLLYADALAYTQDQQMAGKPAELVFKVLAREPDNVSALWYGGMAKAQVSENTEAVRIWRKLAGLLPPNSQAQKEVLDLIGKVELMPNQGAIVTGTDTHPASNKTGGTDTDVVLGLQVSLAPEFKASVAPSDTVFIYAQAPTGGRMPLAIVRKQVADLPVSVTLTDAQAMMPTMKLSGFAKVKLLARVSKSGNAMAQSGDLIGTLDDVSTRDKSSHTLVINGVVK